MDKQTSARAAAEAASHTTAGFFQGLGWALAGLAVTAVLVLWHMILVVALPITACFLFYRWFKHGRRSAIASDPIFSEAGKTAKKLIAES
jgi:hypothetical protein